MKFYLIKDVSEDYVNGVIVQDEQGLGIGARLKEGNVNYPKDIVQRLFEHEEITKEVTTPAGIASKALTKFDKDYLTSLLKKLRPPLQIWREGKFTRAEPAKDATAKLWNMFGNPDSEMPSFISL
jgi:hypothetical protein